MIQSIINNAPVVLADQPSVNTQLRAVFSKINSIVMVEVLEKSGNNYKLLVNGKLFQSLLPITSKVGEEFLANVIRQSPFTLSVDNLTGLSVLSKAELQDIFSKFGLSYKPLIKSAFKKIAEANKPLIKSKLKRLAELLQETDCSPDDYNFMLLVNMIWEENESTESSEYLELLKVLDISFYELCKNISECIQLVKSLNISDSLIARISSKIILEENDEKINYDVIKDKSDSFYDIIKLLDIETNSGNLSYIQISSLTSLKNLLLKYILQKAVYVKNGENPEFCLLNSNDELKVVQFEIRKSSDSKGNPCFVINSAFPSADEEPLDLRVICSDDRISGVIKTSAQEMNKMNLILKKFNSFIFANRKMKTNIVAELDVNSSRMPVMEFKNRIKTVNSCA